MQGVRLVRSRRVRMRSRVAVVAAVATVAIPSGAAAQSASPGAASETSPTSVPGELIVGFKQSSSGSERAAARQRAKVRASRQLVIEGTQLVRVEDGTSTEAARAQLSREPLVRYVQPNYVYETTATTPNDPRFLDGGLWGLHNSPLSRPAYGGVDDADIDAPEAWDLATGVRGRQVIVAVADTGVLASHPDLADRIWTNRDEIPGNGVDDDGNGKIDDVHGWNTYGNNANFTDTHGHGTHVAGTIGATGNNGIGITGVSWGTTIMPVKVLDPSGTSTSVGDGFAYAGENGADVVNASLGCFPCPPDPYDAEVMNAHPRTLYVVSAGNASHNAGLNSPCNTVADNLICVAATDSSDNLAGFSNFSSTEVDIGAPGVDVLSTSLENRLFFENFPNGINPAIWSSTGPWTERNDAVNHWMYAENADATLTSVEGLDLAGETGCSVGWFSIQEVTGDGQLYIEWSTDGTTWTVAGTRGRDFFWNEERLTIPSADDLHLRFRFASDGDDNIAIDAIKVKCDGVGYVTLSGTSMASPHVAGAAALLLAGAPSTKVPELRAALLNEGDPIPALAGKTVTGRRLNVFNSLRSVMPRGAGNGRGTAPGTG